MTIALVVLNTLVLVVLAGSAAVIKRSGGAYLTEKGKNFATKQDIAEITRQIESVKSEFHEQRTGSTLLQEKRFEVIGKTFELLQDPHEYIRHMVHPLQFGDDDAESNRRTQAIDSYNELASYFSKHKIYLPRDLEASVSEVVDLMKTVVNKYTSGRRRFQTDEGTELWNDAFQTMKKTVPPLLEELERRFRAEVEKHERPDA